MKPEVGTAIFEIKQPEVASSPIAHSTGHRYGKSTFGTKMLLKILTVVRDILEATFLRKLAFRTE